MAVIELDAAERQDDLTMTYYGKGNLMGKFLQVLALVTTLIPPPALAAEHELAGTYQLVSSSTKYLDTGEVVPDQNVKGFIMYGADGRMLVLNTYGGRPKPESSAKMTDEQRIGLFRTMLAYGGTYTFDGKTIEHHVDICWDEVRCGTTVVRNVTRDGDRLIYTTKPQPSPFNGRMTVVTLVWAKAEVVDRHNADANPTYCWRDPTSIER